MLHGTLTLMTRSLRDAARRRRAHWVRLASVIILLGMLIEAHISSGALGAPGLRLFRSICYLSVALISLAGLGFFAGVISEEKEEGTLGLLKLADLSTLSIVLGKSTSRLAIALVVFVGQLPFALLSITLGGLTFGQVWAAYVGMAAYLVLVANIALLCSVVSRRTSSASLLLLLVLMLGQGAAPWLSARRAGLEREKLVPVNSAAMDMVWDSCEFLDSNSILSRIDHILTTGFEETAFSTQVWTNLAAAVVVFVISCLVFNRFTEYVGPDAAEGGDALRFWHRRAMRGRPWRWAVVWKDFYFVSGGAAFFLVKTGLYMALIVALYSQYEFVWILFGTLAEAAWLSAIVFAVVELLVLSTRTFHYERANGALPCLVVLPRSLISIGYAKLAGCLLGSLPTVLMFVVLVRIAPLPSLHEDEFFWGLVPAIVAFVVLLHLTVLYSLIVRWGALPLAIGTLVLGGTCVVSIVATAVATIYTAGGGGPATAFGPVVYTGCVLSAALQVAIGFRLRAVAAQ